MADGSKERIFVEFKASDQKLQLTLGVKHYDPPTYLQGSQDPQPLYHLRPLCRYDQANVPELCVVCMDEEMPSVFYVFAHALESVFWWLQVMCVCVGVWGVCGRMSRCVYR